MHQINSAGQFGLPLSVADIHPFPIRIALTEQEAAFALGISKDFLGKLRRKGEAPPHRRIGDRIVYSVDGLRAWLMKEEEAARSDPKPQPSGAAEGEITAHKRPRGRPRKQPHLRRGAEG